MFRRNAFPVLVAAFAATVAVGCGGGGSSSRNNNSSAGSSATAATTSGQFVAVGKLATGRVGHSATLVPGSGALGGKVVVMGGMGKSGSTQIALDTAEVYDPATGMFAPVQSRLSGPRANHGAAATALGEIVAFGGQSDASGTTAIRTVENFQSSTQTFRLATSQLSDARTEPTVLTFEHLGAQRMIAAGGRVSTSGRTAGDVFLADTVSSLGRADFRTARYGADAVQLPSGKVFVAGGLTTSAELYDPAQGTAGTFSSFAGNLSSVRFRGGVAMVGTQAAVIGGRQNDTNAATAQATIEIYDETNNTFQFATEQLPEPMSSFATVKLQNGDVLLLGGQNASGQVLNSAIVISGNGVDVTVTRLSATMTTGRKDAAATVLANGTVLLTGGTDASGNPVDQAELFVFNTSQAPTAPATTGVTPVLTSLSPNQGPVGTTVTITGTGFSFTPDDNVVTFGGILAPVQSVLSGSNGSTDLRVVVPPALANGAHAVTVTVGSLTSTSQTFTVGGGSTTGGTGSTGSTGTTGPQFSGPPHILFAIPSSGGSFMPVAIIGSNFDNPSVPFINGVPSISLFNFGIRNIPFIGSFTVGSTIVPVAAPSGPGSLQIEYNGLLSNQYPFTKN